MMKFTPNELITLDTALNVAAADMRRALITLDTALNVAAMAYDEDAERMIETPLIAADYTRASERARVLSNRIRNYLDSEALS